MLQVPCQPFGRTGCLGFAALLLAALGAAPPPPSAALAVAGVVVDDGGRPVADAVVSGFTVVRDGRFTHQFPLGEKRTGADGGFRLAPQDPARASRHGA